MNNVLRFTHPRRVRERVQEEACAWLVKLDSGASEEELGQLRAWMDETPEHRKVLLEVAALWNQISVLSALSEIFPLAEYSSDRSARRHRTWAAAGLAAVLAGVVSIASLNPPEGRDPRPGLEEGSYLSRAFATRVGEQSTVTLPDGSEIILNTDTSLEVDYSAAERKVSLLHGEGHFSVARDASRPFRVHAGTRVVEAVGTAFAVQHLQQEDVEVTVTQGRVNLFRQAPAAAAAPAPPRAEAVDAAGDAAVSLVAGESVSLTEGDDAVRKVSMQPIEVQERLAWRYGMLLFKEDPLEQVIEEVSRYTSVRIDMADEVREIKVTGYFPTGDIEGLLFSVSESFYVNVERIADDHVVLRAR